MLLMFMFFLCLFFFFQAEDGIRDPLVTGVQTCALPICLRAARRAGDRAGEERPVGGLAPGAAAGPRAARAHAGPVRRRPRRPGGGAQGRALRDAYALHRAPRATRVRAGHGRRARGILAPRAGERRAVAPRSGGARDRGHHQRRDAAADEAGRYSHQHGTRRADPRGGARDRVGGRSTGRRGTRRLPGGAAHPPATPARAAHRAAPPPGQRHTRDAAADGDDRAGERPGGARGRPAVDPGVPEVNLTPEMSRPERTTILDARALSRALQRMAVEVLELAHGTEDLLLMGIQRRGVELAERIAKQIETDEGVAVPRGALDITLYRDDLQTVGPKPVIGETRIPGDLTGKHVVIVDDVLYTGRTVRAALDELADFGRPKRISLCVLVDRGGRELPIQPDIVGKQVKVNSNERVDVLVEELDGRDSVELVSGRGGPG